MFADICNDLWQICSVQNVSFKKLQDGFTYPKDGSYPCCPKTGVTNTNIAAVAGLNKQDVRLTHSVGISSGSDLAAKN